MGLKSKQENQRQESNSVPTVRVPQEHQSTKSQHNADNVGQTYAHFLFITSVSVSPCEWLVNWFSGHFFLTVPSISLVSKVPIIPSPPQPEDTPIIQTLRLKINKWNLRKLKSSIMQRIPLIGQKSSLHNGKIFSSIALSVFHVALKIENKKLVFWSLCL